MHEVGTGIGDSEAEPREGLCLIQGGRIPGLAAMPAFTVQALDPSPIPVVIAVPHAGRSYPRALLDRMRHPEYAAPRLEDRHADALALAIAQETGATLLVAHAPRAMLDLNRAPEDIDWDMVVGAPPQRAGTAAGPALRARSGLGLVPRRLPGLGELWKRRLPHGEVIDRITAIHEPYHAMLDRILGEVRDRWGAVLLIDLHSMPPLPARAGEVAPQFVLGDRFGAACDGMLVASAFVHFAQERRSAAHNRPYAGGYVLERHAARSHGIHGLQVEIDRQCYLDSRLSEPGAGLDDVVAVLCGLVRRLAGDVAEIGRGAGRTPWQMAAE
jgi:N-formylglutamate amidohydrolase